MTALSVELRRSMRVMASFTSSRGVTAPRRTRLACAVASRRASSLFTDVPRVELVPRRRLSGNTQSSCDTAGIVRSAVSASIPRVVSGSRARVAALRCIDIVVGPSDKLSPVPVVAFRAPVRRRLHEDVFEQLRDAILDGRFATGTKLPPERELALEFGVNRTSVREAIKVLESLGLVVVRQGDGASVRPLVDASLDVLGPMIFHGGRIDLALVAEMVEVMRPLMLEMGRLALERCRPGDLVAIRRFRDVAA